MGVFRSRREDIIRSHANHDGVDLVLQQSLVCPELVGPPAPDGRDDQPCKKAEPKESAHDTSHYCPSVVRPCIQNALWVPSSGLISAA